jgi:hypothetical protein
MPSLPEYWLSKNTNWEHIQCDFIEFDETNNMILLFQFLYLNILVFGLLGIEWLMV